MSEPPYIRKIVSGGKQKTKEEFYEKIERKKEKLKNTKT